VIGGFLGFTIRVERTRQIFEHIGLGAAAGGFAGTFLGLMYWLGATAAS
jgi:uncharacterized membrane protein